MQYRGNTLKTNKLPRAYFILLSALVYGTGYLTYHFDIFSEATLFIYPLLYFVALPFVYLLFVTDCFKAGWYKLLMILLFGASVSRLTFLQNVEHFADYTYIIKILVIFVVLFLNFKLFAKIMKDISSALRRDEDPRLSIAKEYRVKEVPDTAKIGMLALSEVANWFFLLRKIKSRHNQLKIATVHGSKKILYLLLATIVSFAYLIFSSLYNQHIVLAIFMVILVLYSLPMIVANYRVSEYHSIYASGKYIVIANGVWSIAAIHADDIEAIEEGYWDKDSDSETVYLGRKNLYNLMIKMKTNCNYFGFLGQNIRRVNRIVITVENKQILMDIFANFKDSRAVNV